MLLEKQKLIVELSGKERADRLENVLVNALKKAKELNQPVIYRNELCIKPNLFIHKYPNGKTVLIEQDSHNSAEKIVRQLS